MLQQQYQNTFSHVCVQYQTETGWYRKDIVRYHILSFLRGNCSKRFFFEGRGEGGEKRVINVEVNKVSSHTLLLSFWD